jgi:EmrB/QacA subfamily drug resistance transporter
MVEKNQQLAGREAFFSMLGICFVVMLTALDQTVVGTAMPRIVAELQGFEYYSWVGACYLLTSAVAVPLTGRLGDMYGRKPFVLLAIVSFTAASALCGAARSMPELILARALQGIGGGMLIGTTFASITDLFPDTGRRIRWMAMVTTTFGLSNAVGPMLGGFMTEHLGWRSVFYVNLPIGVIAAWVVTRYLPRFPGHRQPGEKIDWLDAVLLAAGLSALLLALEDGGRLGYTSIWFAGLLILGLGAGSAFIWRLPRVSAPIIPPRMVAIGAVRRLMILSFLSGLVMFMLVFFLPLLLQGGFAHSPKSAGMLMTPLAVGIPVGSFINGRLLSRLSWGHKLMACGFVALALGCFLLCLLDAQSGSIPIMAVLGLCGLSFGFQFPNLNLQMQAAVERSDVGAGAALVNTMRMFGSMLSATLTALLVNTCYESAVAGLLAKLGAVAGRARPWLENPQVLIRQSDQKALAEVLTGMPVDVSKLIDLARIGLIDGIHVALYVGIALALVSAWVALKLPPMELKKG